MPGLIQPASTATAGARSEGWRRHIGTEGGTVGAASDRWHVPYQAATASLSNSGTVSPSARSGIMFQTGQGGTLRDLGISTIAVPTAAMTVRLSIYANVTTAGALYPGALLWAGTSQSWTTATAAGVKAFPCDYVVPADTLLWLDVHASGGSANITSVNATTVINALGYSSGAPGSSNSGTHWSLAPANALTGTADPTWPTGASIVNTAPPAVFVRWASV